MRELGIDYFSDNDHKIEHSIVEFKKEISDSKLIIKEMKTLWGEIWAIVLMNNINQKLISIIVPCFNSGKTIQRTIESLKNQTWDHKEIIVVNDGSNDQDTLDILNELDGVLIVNQKFLTICGKKCRGIYCKR